MLDSHWAAGSLPPERRGVRWLPRGCGRGSPLYHPTGSQRWGETVCADRRGAFGGELFKSGVELAPSPLLVVLPLKVGLGGSPKIQRPPSPAWTWLHSPALSRRWGWQ